MGANADVLRRSDLIGSTARETELPRVAVARETNGWNPADFAHEQIRGLVRRVFFTGGAQPVKQVVFSATEAHTDVAGICDQVGRALALETRADVAIVGREPQRGMVRAHPRDGGGGVIKSWSNQIEANLWRVKAFGLCEGREGSGAGPYWLSCLAGLRIEFEYAVIQGPVAGVSSEAEVLGQLADGIILVLGANSTRRAAARKIKERLEAAQARILGTLLSQRTFPVPERIYRRL
jgi:hypothetical protein